MATDAVRVAVRIRPQNVRELAASYKVCTIVSKTDAQIFIGNDRSFTYDSAFDRDAHQVEVYDACVRDLVAGVFNGLNATVLAYGQTGSGKTYTMGTGFEVNEINTENVGIVPRAAEQIFNTIEELKAQSPEPEESKPKFLIEAQFIELYNEDLIDLLAHDRSAIVQIQENPDNRQIFIKNAATVQVSSADEVLETLRNGSINRTTGFTNMNEKSSRSHAIFSLHIKQEKYEATDGDEKVLAVLSAKLHFVDLAGSERLKRTGATGDRAKEGISINCGLLALGNVISALTGPKKSHVPYRDSKLTRLLQDSLGGNSRTLMIACASPNDVDFSETLNTLTYAARAKAIKNRVTVNKDHGTAMVGQLKARIAALENELNEYRQGKRMVDSGGAEIFSDQYHENTMLNSELNKLRVRANALQESNLALSQRLTQIKEELERERLLKLAPKLDAEGNVDENAQAEFEKALSNIISAYVEDNEKQKLHLSELSSERDEYRKKYFNLRKRQEELGYNNASMLESSFVSVDDNPLITSARKEVEDQKKMHEILMEQMSANTAIQSTTTDENSVDDEEMEIDENDEEAANEMDMLLAEREQQQAKIVMEVANLQDEISTKERLIHELEQSERRMAQIRRDYERKLQELSQRIEATEAERDKMLMEMAKKSNNKLSDDKIREIKQDYEKRLGSLRNDFNKMKTMQSEHERARQRQAAQQQELQRVRRELDEMKRSKVKLVQDMRENAKKVKKVESDLARKMQTLEKNSRIKDNKIRTLQLKDQQREEFMKRKVEQLSALQQQQRQGHMRGSARSDDRRRGLPLGIAKKVYSPGAAKTKWRALETKINACISNHTGFSKLDEQHVRLLNEKVQAEKEGSELDQKFAKAKTIDERQQIQDDIETNQHHLKYLDEQISDVRRAIADMECSNKENADNNEIQGSMNTIIQQCNNLYEAHFLLEQLLQYAVAKAAEAAQKSNKVQLLEARVMESENENAVNETIITGLINSNRRTNSDNFNHTFVLPGETPKRDTTKFLSNTGKIRRRTATSNELLFDTTRSKASDSKAFMAKEDTFIATAIPEEDENRSTASPNGDNSSGLDVAKQYDEFVVSTLVHKDRVVAIDAISNIVVTSCKDRVVRCWDVEQGKEINLLNGNAKTATAVHFVQPNDPSLILCIFSFTAHLFDTRSNQIVSCIHSSGVVDKNRCGTSRGIPASESSLAPFSFSSDGQLFCSRYRDSFRVWDIRNQRQLTKIDLESDQDIKATAVYERSGYYGYLFMGYENGDIQVESIKPGFSGGSHVESTTLIPSHNSRIVSLFTTEKSLYSASKNGTLMKFSLIDLTRDFVENNTHNKTLSQACLLQKPNPTFDTVCTADAKGNLRIWSTENPNKLQLVHDLESAHGGSINGLCSSDNLLFSCSSDQTVKTWKFN